MPYTLIHMESLHSKGHVLLQLNRSTHMFRLAGFGYILN